VALAGAAASSVGATSGATPAAPPVPAAPAPSLLAPPSPALPGLPPVSLELAQIPVSSPSFSSAEARYGAVDAAHGAARDQRVALDHRATALQARLGQLEGVEVASTARAQGLRVRLDEVEQAITALAVEAYTGGGASARLEEALTSETPAIHEADRRAVLGQASMDVLLAERAAYQARIAEAEQRIDDARAEAATLADELDALPAQRAAASADEAERGTEVAVERVAYEEARVLATVDGVDFPLVALDAYHRAAVTIAEVRPACGVRWWAIAGISKVEGRHGTYGGARLDQRGDTSRRIIGIQLNGTNETAVIADSDGGALDGDPQFDRAVGPMQFIPQTWNRFRADGNDDGVESPFNLYDATLAAAGYLCTASSGLEGDAGLRRAYLAYNRSEAYVESVLGHARGYERAVEVPERPA
jgi:membrane-bound lytic murein transglycosylase B